MTNLSYWGCVKYLKNEHCLRNSQYNYTGNVLWFKNHGVFKICCLVAVYWDCQTIRIAAEMCIQLVNKDKNVHIWHRPP